MNREGPSSGLLRLARQLFPDETERAAFIDALATPRPYQPAVLWLRERPAAIPWPVATPPAWFPDFVDLAAPGARPGQDPLHEAGACYCLDPSSVFAASVLRAVPARPDLVVDVCAAPGGKSLFAWRLLAPRHLIANEVIGKRLGPLTGNLRRCGVHPAAVSRADAAVLAAVIPGSAAVVIVDAPCSGQSLLARGHDAPGCFHPATINLNANRQRRILANAAAVTAPGGFLAYMTCTFAEKENEGTIAWFLRRHPHFSAVPVPHLAAHASTFAEFPAYRLWPHRGEGAGAFACLLRREGDPADALSADALRCVWSSDSGNVMADPDVEP